MTDYIRPHLAPPPQLNKADLAGLTPEQITAADDLGQLAVLRTGRQPMPFEQRGERMATDAEADAQRRTEKADAATRKAEAHAEQARQYRQGESR